MAILVTLETAKTILRIVDDLHDGEVQLYLDAAHDVILDYLDAAVDPAWDETTVPRRVSSAVGIMLTHLYEHRGDDMSPSGSGPTPDEDVWAAIRRLLGRTRDQALGVGEATP